MVVVLINHMMVVLINHMMVVLINQPIPVKTYTFQRIL